MPQSVKKSLSDYTVHNKIALVHGGTDFFSRLKHLIDNAKNSVHLHTYIFSDDITGKAIGQALIEAAKRGVMVYMLVDGYASQFLAKSFIAELKNAGIHFRMFEPLFKSGNFYFGRRLHYKVVVVDAYYCLVGGINIADRYNDLPDNPAWLDFALLAEGEVAYNLLQVCIYTWCKSGRGAKKLLEKHVVARRLKNAQCLVRARKNDWVLGQSQVSRSYLQLFRCADEQILIMSSYFLPGRAFRRGLSNAAKRGVAVKVILAGDSDIMLAKHAERYIYRWIFKHKILLYEYTGTVLHAKIATCDKKLVTGGSYNVNNISAFASIEVNLDVKDELFASKVTATLEEIIKNNCVQFTDEYYRTRFNIFQKVWQYIAYEIIRLMYYLFTFYFRQKSE